METEQKNNFLSKIRPIAEQANDLVEEGSGSSLIIIATDRDEAAIVINGTKEELVRALVSFGLHKDTMDIYLESVNEFSKVFDFCRNNANNN